MTTAIRTRNTRSDRIRARRVAEMTEWKNQHAALVEALRPFQTGDTPVRNRFLNDLAEQVFGTIRPLSERQVDAAIRALARHAERQAQYAEADATQAAAGHLGEVGEKVELSVTILQRRAFDRAFNGHLVTSYLVKMLDDHGHVLTTFTSGAFGWDTDAAPEGSRVTIKGTVKAHETYRDLPETQLARVKVVA